MSCRHGYLLLALAAGLPTPVGCMRWQWCEPQMIIAEHPAPSTGELTPAQAAQLCLAAGDALEKKGFIAEAVRQYENARKYDPQARTVARHLAVLYDLQGDTARAEAEYLRALQEQPRDAELLNDFGYFHYRHHHLQTAENWLRKAITMDPNCSCAWVNLGQVLAYQGRGEESYQAFAHVLRPAEAYSNLGILLAKQGRTAESRRALEQAVALDPDLKQPRAFLKALTGMPGPLPPRLTRNAPPAPMPAAKSAAPVPPAASSLVETAKPALPANHNRAVSAPSSPPRLSSQPPVLPAASSDLPVIINGPIRPAPISVRPVSVQMAEQSSATQTCTTVSRKTPPSPPPAPPPPPPFASRPPANEEGPILIRASTPAVQPVVPPSRSELAPPSPLPLVPPSIPLVPPPAPRQPLPTARPQAVLTDCQGEPEPENGPQNDRN